MLQDVRAQALLNWLKNDTPIIVDRVEPLTGDASFRRYFRVYTSNTSYIAMDAPPDREALQPYVAIAQSLYALSVRVPEIVAANREEGFLLLSDLGDELFIRIFSDNNVDQLYSLGIKTLLLLQKCREVHDYELPRYDEKKLRFEMNLFDEWYLGRHLGIVLSHKQRETLNYCYDLLIEDALEQPQIFVHRDYHSRNLLLLPHEEVGVLDFQDAVWGPVTYDIMSLIMDCFIAWPQEKIARWTEEYRMGALSEGFIKYDNPRQFQQWFDWIGLQRHLKCIGIFSRLHYRDHKADYLKHIPRVIEYAKAICHRYKEFSGLLELL